jgi:hypothetical protein
MMTRLCNAPPLRERSEEDEGRAESQRRVIRIRKESVIGVSQSKGLCGRGHGGSVSVFYPRAQYSDMTRASESHK